MGFSTSSKYGGIRGSKMRLTVYHGTRWQHDNARRFINWYTDNNLPKATQEKLLVQVNVSAKGNSILRGDYGVCEYIMEDRSLGWEHCRISILAPKNISHYKFLSRLAHECVHMKQYTTHELREVEHGNIFRKERYDDSAVDVWTAPWEVEAFGKEVYLTSEYAVAFGIEKDVFKKYVNQTLF